MMKKMTEQEKRQANGGYKIYSCPWNDYSSRSYWSTYGHAIRCACNRGLFNIPIRMIKTGIKNYFKG